MIIKILPLSGPNSATPGQAKKQMYWLSSLNRQNMAAFRGSHHVVMTVICPFGCEFFCPWLVPSFRRALPGQWGRWFPGSWGPVLRGRSVGLRVEYSPDRQGDEAHWVQVLASQSTVTSFRPLYAPADARLLWGHGVTRASGQLLERLIPRSSACPLPWSQFSCCEPGFIFALWRWTVSTFWLSGETEWVTRHTLS